MKKHSTHTLTGLGGLSKRKSTKVIRGRIKAILHIRIGKSDNKGGIHDRR